MNEVVIPLKLSGIAALKAELKDLKNQMADAANPEAFAALADKAGDVQKQINKVNNSINDFKKGSNLDQAKASFDAMGESIMKLDFTKAAKQSANLKQTLGTLTPADLTKGFKGFITTLKNLGGAFVKLGVTILMNPIFLIVAAVTAIIAVIALVLNKFGLLDGVIKALMTPINALIAGFKAILAANEKVNKSSEERTAIVTADLGREIAEAKAAGKDTTKLEEERSNVQIKEANNRKKTAIDAIKKQKALGKNADKEKLEIAAARKIVTDSTKTAQQIELDDLAAAYKKKIAEAVKYKNDTTALVEAQKVQEAAIIKKYDDAAKAAEAAYSCS
jgi:hypothetical protein